MDARYALVGLIHSPRSLSVRQHQCPIRNAEIIGLISLEHSEYRSIRHDLPADLAPELRGRPSPSWALWRCHPGLSYPSRSVLGAGYLTGGPRNQSLLQPEKPKCAHSGDT
jgi:hypothetical protein